jgi:hypothetical protein
MKRKTFSAFVGIKHIVWKIGAHNVLATAICVQAQTANISAFFFFTFETGCLPLETEMFHRSCDMSH